MPEALVHIWELRGPDAAAVGLPFARGRLDATEILLVHAAPRLLEAEVRAEDGHRVALGTSLERTLDSPMVRLSVRDGRIERKDLWPDERDLGRPVLLPSGEVGILRAWWHAGDHSDWRSSSSTGGRWRTGGAGARL